MLSALCQFYPHIFSPILFCDHLSILLMCYFLSDIQVINYLERRLPILISIQHSETQFDLWILHASMHTTWPWSQMGKEHNLFSQGWYVHSQLINVQFWLPSRQLKTAESWSVEEIHHRCEFLWWVLCNISVLRSKLHCSPVPFALLLHMRPGLNLFQKGTRKVLIWGHFLSWNFIQINFFEKRCDVFICDSAFTLYVEQWLQESC